MEHFCEPVEGGIGVGAADGFDESGNGVVVLVAVGVVENGFLLNGLLRDGEIDDDLVLGRGSGDDSEFEGGEGFSSVSVGFFRDVLQGFGVGGDGEVSESSFGVREGAFEEVDEVLRGNWFELKNLRARDEGGVDVEIGIVRGGTDEADGSAFEVGEEDILLGFVEAVNFVDEEDGGLIAELGVGFGLVDFGPDLGDV